MLGFVVAFKGRLNSKNWERDGLLLRRTLESLLNQRDRDFQIFVSYTDLPDNPLQHDKVNWIKFPYKFLEIDEITDKEVFLTRYTLGSYLAGFYDQGKKSLYASKFAKEAGCNYIMSVDYDDLISNRLAEYVNNSDQTTNFGWYMNSGFMYTEGSNRLLKVSEHINYRCGSANIIRKDYVPSPDFSSTNYQDFKFFPTHNFIPQWLKIDYNITIRPLPFPGLIYLIHSSNFYNPASTFKSRGLKDGIKNALKKILYSRRITRSIREEFNLYSIGS